MMHRMEACRDNRAAERTMIGVFSQKERSRLADHLAFTGTSFSFHGNIVPIVHGQTRQELQGTFTIATNDVIKVQRWCALRGIVIWQF